VTYDDYKRKKEAIEDQLSKESAGAGEGADEGAVFSEVAVFSEGAVFRAFLPKGLIYLSPKD